MDGTIKQAVVFIEKNYNKDISLIDIAKQVNLSPYHFSRIFKEQTKYTPRQFLINYRINYAKDLLYTSNFSIGEIAFKCGFNSESYFVTTFKKHTGYSPKKYQEFIFKITI
ncbi:AraC family transcriptional regulator [Oceanobacillus sp. 143]|nr:AraC family transcriptional regulator [Oceanobacillus sp. 143]